ncbi:MAG: flagellar hook assembly protein FlgD [Alphaproteobacteria bacterium]|nr:flagellar hook assembly protein FlgD [Alphaproteobacteria bacterium]
MVSTDVSVTDNIKNFTAAGKAEQKSKADKAADTLFSNTEDFIKLLTVQLQNQDPSKPLETDQITQQIASLSQVEQQINTNKNLESLIAAFTRQQVSSNVPYIGKLVEAPGNLASLLGGTGVFVYNLDKEANDVQITISNTKGDVVYKGSGTKLAGRNQIVWDGKDNAGKQLPDGTYKIAVKATGIDGKTIAATTASSGRVTSVETLDGTNYLALGDILVPLDKVISVRELPALAS